VLARRLGAAAVVALLFGVVLARPGAAVAAAPAEFFGVSAVDPAPSDFERMGKGDVGTYRMLLAWPTVQAARNAPYDWSAPDLEVSRAVSNGMQPLPFLYGSPPFAGASKQTAPLGSAVARQGWQRFVAAAVRRYGPKGDFWDENPALPYRPADAWQVWNEPNAEHFWKSKPSPRKYAKLLKLTSPVIRSVDPRAQIVLGGMFGFPNGAKSIPLRTFLKELYRIRSARKQFDGVAVHPYGGTLRLMTYQISRARKIMDRAGDDAKPIWVTELGWATDGPQKWPLVTTAQGQATLLRKSFDLLLKRRKRYGIRRVIWFVWRDFKHPACEWCGSAGLLNRQGVPKPAWSQFRNFTARTAG
jgi:hypothetical protein